MTVVQSKEASIETQNYQLLRSSTGLLAGLYGSVKDYSPILKSSLETVESQIPPEWVERVQAAGEPVISQLDNKIAEKVIQPVQGATGALTQAAETKVVELKSLRSDLLKQAVDRLEKGFVNVQEFSATRGKELIHFDLVAYSKEAFDNATVAAEPVIDPLRQQLETAIANMNKALESLRETMLAKCNQVGENTAELKQRLAYAVAVAKELSRNTMAYLQSKLTTIREKVPDNAAVLAQLPPILQSSLDLFAEIRTKAELDSSTKALDNVYNLLAAAQDVLKPIIKNATTAKQE